MVQTARSQAFQECLLVMIRLSTKHRLTKKLNTKTSQKEGKLVYKRLLKKVHPDKGGDDADFKELRAAWEAVEKAGSAGGGRPARDGGTRPAAQPAQPKRSAPGGDVCTASTALTSFACHPCGDCSAEGGNFRVHCKAALFTYNGLSSWEDWLAFLNYVKSELIKTMAVLYWCARKG